MDYIISFVLITFSALLLRIAIDILKTPNEVYNRNHNLTKQMKNGFVDSEHVETLLSVDTRTGQLHATQQLKRKSLFE